MSFIEMRGTSGTRNVTYLFRKEQIMGIWLFESTTPSQITIDIVLSGFNSPFSTALNINGYEERKIAIGRLKELFKESLGNSNRWDYLDLGSLEIK
jgi:hypothetical protein